MREQVWLALALGSATIKEYRLKTTTLYAGSEHAMGRRPGEFFGSMGPLERAKSVPEGLLDAAWTLLSSWRPLGALLEASRVPGPKKQSWNRLLAAPQGLWRLVSAILRPKGRPGGVKNAPKSSSKSDPSWKPQNLEI